MKHLPIADAAEPTVEQLSNWVIENYLSGGDPTMFKAFAREVIQQALRDSETRGYGEGFRDGSEASGQ